MPPDPQRFLAKNAERTIQRALRRFSAWLGTATANSWLSSGSVTVLPQGGDALEDEELTITRLKGSPINAGEHVLILTIDGKDYVLGAFGGDQGGLANGVAFDQDANTGAAVGSSADTTNYVEHSTWTWTLPAGTWTVYAEATGWYSNATAGNGADARVTGFATGPSIGNNSPVANAPFAVTVETSASGISGTVTIILEYKSRSGGTVTARHSSFRARALRTSMT